MATALYVVRADVEAELDAATLLSALNDDKAVPPVEKAGLFDALAEAVDAEVSAAVGLISAMGRPTPPLTFLRYYARIAMCSLLYRRRGMVGERNPFEDKEAKLKEQLDSIADGDTKTHAGFAHMSLDDAEPDIFIPESEAGASSSSGGGGGGGGGVSSINGAEGAVRLVAGSNASVSTLGGVITVSGPEPGVSSLEGLTGAVRLVGGENITISQSGNTLTVNGEAGGEVPENPFTEAIENQAPDGTYWVVEGQIDFENQVYFNDDIWLDNGRGINLGGIRRTTWPSTTVNGEDGAVRLLAGENVSITPNGKDFTISATGGGGAETARIITTATATVEDGDTLILMDTATAAQAQTLTLPATMTADAMTVTVRQLGTAGVTIANGANEYHLTYDGDWVTLDWIAGKGWFWRA